VTTNDAHTAYSVLADDFLTRFTDEGVFELESTSAADISGVLGALPVPTGALILNRLQTGVAAEVVRLLDRDSRRALLGAADPLRAVAFLARIEEPTRVEIVNDLDEITANEINGLLSYPADSAGGMMDPRVPIIGADHSVSEALEGLRQQRDRRIVSIYVVNAAGTYVGRIALQELAIAEPTARLRDLITDPPVSVRATASQTEVVELFEAHRILALPVVDFEGRLVGYIPNRSLMEAVEQEATADIQSMVGVSREERALSPVGFAVCKRLPWLEVNLLTAFLAASVVGLFEGTIARFTALAVLLPVVAGQSGNTGAQALAVTMRGLALREVRVRNWLRVASKEIRVAFINGIAVAVSTAAAVFLWSRSPGLTLVIGTSMILSMVAAGLSGAAIPMILTALRQDPAQSSSIILTTVTDVVGFFSFLGIATMLSGML
jgi:magnesium transporter